MIHSQVHHAATDPRPAPRAAAAAALRAACPACGSARLDHIYSVPDVPVHSCILLQTRQAALDYTRRDIELAFCHDCGFAFNAAYDPAVQEYSVNFEESQHFSQTFNRFAAALAERLARDHDLTNRTVLEIGCGKGEFLAMLCRIAGCRGIGIDPGCRPERIQDDALRSQIEFIRDFYGPQHARLQADMILCRHTLEHIGPVRDFLASIRAALALRHAEPEPPVIFETPDALRVLREGAFWDIYYEHCSYFTPGAHARAFQAAGFLVTDLALAYDGQYIIQSALPARSNRAPARAPTLPLEQDLDLARAAAAAFPRRVADTIRHWREQLSAARDRHRRIALWGGGSKAVAFATTLGLDGAIDYVIDINPHKQGRFLPGAALPVLHPDHVASEPPDLVIAMNPIYREEIRRDLDARGVRCELAAL